MHVSTALDACDLLDADHLAVKHLFVEYARLPHAAPPADDGRAALAHRICDELEVHARIEEEIFYPELERARPELAGVLAGSRAEHDAVEAQAARIRGMQVADAATDAAVTELARLVDHHVKEERDELFPKARSTPSLDLRGLADRLRERQRAVAPA